MKSIFKRILSFSISCALLITLSSCGQITTGVLKAVGDQNLVDLFQLLIQGTNNAAPGVCVEGSITLLKNGAAAAPTTNIPVTLGLPDGIQAFTSRSAGLCVGQTTTATLTPAGGATKTIYFKANAAGTYAVSVTSTQTNVSGSTISLSFSVPTNTIPAKLRINGPSTVQIGDMTSFTVDLLNSANQSVVATQDTVVTVSTTSVLGTDHLFSQPNSPNETNTITIQNGNNSATVYYKGDAPPRSVTLNATAAGLTGTQFAINLTAASASRLVLLGPDPLSIVAGTCNIFVAQLQDANGVGIVSHPSVTGTLSGTLPNNSAYSINSCAAGTNLINNQFTISDGTSVAVFYLRIDVANQTGYTLNAQASNYSAASKNIIVLGSTSLTLAGQIQPPGTVQAFTDTCLNYKLGLVDQTGNIVTVPQAFTANIVDDPLGGTFTLNPDCTGNSINTLNFPVGTTFITVGYRRPSIGETVLAVTPNVNIYGGSMTLPIRFVSGRPISLLLRKSYTTNPKAGECSQALLLNQIDAQSNITPVVTAYYATLNFSEFEGSPAPVAYMDAGCSQPLDYLTGSSGPQRFLMAVDPIFTSPSPKFIYFKYGKPNDDFKLTASSTANPALNASTTELRVEPGAAGKIVFIAAPSNTQVNSCSAAFVAQAQDATGTPTIAAAGGLAFAIATNPAVGITAYLDAACSILAGGTASIPQGSSQTSLYFKGTQIQNYNISITSAFNTSTVFTAFSSGAASDIVWRFAPVSQPNNFTTTLTLPVNTCSGQLANPISGKLSSVDNQGNLAPAPNQVVFDGMQALLVPGGAVTSLLRAYQDADCLVPMSGATISNGLTQSEHVYFKATNPGTFLTRATRANSTAVEATVLINPAAPNHMVFTGPTVLQAGQCSSQLLGGGMQLFSFDQFNFLSPLLSQAAITLLVNNGALKFYSDPGCTTEISTLTFLATASSATPNPVYAKAPTVGDYIITFQAQAGSGLANLTVNLTVQSGNPGSLSLFVADASQTTFQVAHYTARLRDQLGNTITFPNATAATLRERNGASGINIYSGHITSNSQTACPAGGSSGPLNVNFGAGSAAEIDYSVCGSLPTTTKRAIVNIVVPYFSTNITWDQYINVVSNSCTNGTTMTLHEALPSCTAFGCEVIFYYSCNNGNWVLVSIYDPRYSGCFAPETQIAMANGMVKRADSVKVGDKVWNPITEEVVDVIKVVAGAEKKPLIEFQIEASKKLRVSDKHPMWTQSGFKQAGAVTLADKLLGQDGKFHRILSRKDLPVKKGQLVYNFVVGSPSGDHLDSMVLADGVVTGDLKAQIWLEDQKVKPMANSVPLTLKRKNYCELDPQDPVRHLYSKIYPK